MKRTKKRKRKKLPVDLWCEDHDHAYNPDTTCKYCDSDAAARSSEGFGNLCCSFCGKSQREVGKLISGPTVYICNECVDLSNDILQEEAAEKRTGIKKEVAAETPSEIKKALGRYIIGQTDAQKTLAVALYNHRKRISNPNLKLDKSNILMVGPTGSGKTAIVKALATVLDVPFAIADATGLTAAGYVGSDVETILKTLIANAGGDLERASHGIIYIDEIDKIACRQGDADKVTNGGVGSIDVQQGLLKLIEGSEVEIPTGKGNRKHPELEGELLNTENILFICGGAFVGLNDIVKARYFNKDAHVLPEDLFKFGMIPEFVGRLPVITELKALTKNDLAEILTKPKNAVLPQYERLVATEGAKLVFDKGAIDRIAEIALKRNTGARGLKSIVESALKELLFTLPDLKPVKRILINAGVIDGTSEPVITKSKKRQKRGSK